MEKRVGEAQILLIQTIQDKMAIVIENIFYLMYTLIGPFLIVLSMSYGLLRRTRVLGDPKKFKKIYFVLSFIFSVYFVISLSSREFASKYIAAFMYQTLILFFILMLLSTFIEPRRREDTGSSAFGKIIGIVGIMSLIAIWYASSTNPDAAINLSTTIFNVINTYIIQTGLYVILIIFGGFYLMFKWLTSEPEEDRDGRRIRDVIRRNIEEIVDELVRERQ